MRNRNPALCNKAISAAWKRERQLVSEGKGTRDWTPEQQRDILTSGKAHDENGEAFEGQHMKSAEAYPEYQDDPDNIQFLSHDEHLYGAHQGNYQNPTNGYYDPETGEMNEFEEHELEACELIDLSEPVVELDNREGEDSDESQTEESSEQEEQASDLAEGADESASKVESSEEDQSYGY